MEVRHDLTHLLARVALRDRRAFRRLYDMTAPKLFGVVLRIVKRRVEAEIATQKAYARIWRTASRFRPEQCSAFSWMIAIARAAALDAARDGPPSTADLDAIEDGPVPEAEATDFEAEAARVRAWFEAMPEAERRAFEGCFAEGWTYATAAEKLEAPVGELRRTLRRRLFELGDDLQRPS